MAHEGNRIKCGNLYFILVRYLSEEQNKRFLCVTKIRKDLGRVYYYYLENECLELSDNLKYAETNWLSVKGARIAWMLKT